MSNIRGYIIAFLSGALIVAISVLIYVLKTAKPVINTDSYVQSLEQSIGKIKGDGNITTPTIVTTKQEETKPPESLFEWLKQRKLRKQERNINNKN